MDKSPLSDIIGNPFLWATTPKEKNVCQHEKQEYDRCEYNRKIVYIGLNCDKETDKYVKCLEKDVNVRRGNV
jgi:hypothetical protein